MIVAVTPARGGSKGISRKNIIEIAGKPLLAWTIESALASHRIDRYVVSTEDAEIAEIACRYGAEVLERPDNLATDEASTLDVLVHTVNEIPCDTVILLQATSPIRNSGRIDECVAEFYQSIYDSLATGFICKYQPYGTCNLRRQDISGFFYDDGNVYVIRADLLQKKNRYGNNLGMKVISRWENVEIDDEFDLWIAEKILLDRVHE